MEACAIYYGPTEKKKIIEYGKPISFFLLDKFSISNLFLFLLYQHNFCSFIVPFHYILKKGNIHYWQLQHK